MVVQHGAHVIVHIRPHAMNLMARGRMRDRSMSRSINQYDLHKDGLDRSGVPMALSSISLSADSTQVNVPSAHHRSSLVHFTQTLPSNFPSTSGKLVIDIKAPQNLQDFLSSSGIFVKNNLGYHSPRLDYNLRTDKSHEWDTLTRNQSRISGHDTKDLASAQYFGIIVILIIAVVWIMGRTLADSKMHDEDGWMESMEDGLRLVDKESNVCDATDSTSNIASVTSGSVGGELRGFVSAITYMETSTSRDSTPIVGPGLWLLCWLGLITMFLLLIIVFGFNVFFGFSILMKGMEGGWKLDAIAHIGLGSVALGVGCAYAIVALLWSRAWLLVVRKLRIEKSGLVLPEGFEVEV